MLPLYDSVTQEPHEIYITISVLRMKRWELSEAKRLAQSDQLVSVGTRIQMKL